MSASVYRMAQAKPELTCFIQWHPNYFVNVQFLALFDAQQGDMKEKQTFTNTSPAVRFYT